MLKRVLEQMQFVQEHTGGGCNAMTLYKDGHAIVVTIDAHTQFEHVSADNPILIGIYRTVNRYQWGEESNVTYTEAHGEADALNVIIDALDYVEQLATDNKAEGFDALTKVWGLIEKRHGLLPTCASEVNLAVIDEEYRPEIHAFRCLWDAMVEGVQ